MSLEMILEVASGKDIQMLKYQARRIMDVLNKRAPSFGEFFHEIDALELPNSIPEKDEARLDLDLNTFIRKIKKKQKLGQNHVNAFLATIPPQDQVLRENYLLIQARLLLVVHELSQLSGYGGFIEGALREYRLLIDREKWEWLNQLPDFSRHISDLVDELGQAREKLPPEPKSRTLAFVSLLKQYQKNKHIYVPRSVKRQAKTPKVSVKKFKFANTQLDFEDDETSYCEFLPEKSEGNQTGINNDEYVADQVATKRFFKFKLVAPDEVKQSLNLQVTAAKSAMNHIQRREKMLITDSSFLTDHEVSVVIDHCFKNLEKDAHYSVLLIMLFTGKSPEEAITDIENVKLSKNAPFNEHAIFVFDPDLPKHLVDDDMESLLDRSNGSVIQALPQEIRNCINHYENKLKNITRISVEIRNTIKKLNQDNSTHLTETRITNYLICYLNNLGVDSTEITLLLGRGLRQDSGTYYYQINAGELLSIHQNYINELMSRSSYKTKIVDERSTKKVGSQLVVKLEQVTSLFNLMAKQLEEMRAGDWSQIEQFHNLYTIHCIELLNLATGHRPVRHPYEDINKFDLIAGTLFISDKEERSELAARVIALPDIAVEQIKLYQQHLKKLESEIASFSYKSSQAINKAISGEGPLFFFLSGFTVEPVIPANLSVELEKTWPLPLNWHRHFMRTWLRKNGFSGQLTNAWMGHLSMGSAGLSRYSGLSMSDLKKIAESIQKFLSSEIKIKTISPWK